MMTETKPELETESKHSGLWVLVVTDAEDYSLPLSQCGIVFNSEQNAINFAVQLLIDRNHVQRDGDAFVMDGDRFETAKETLEEYQWILSGLEYFHVFPGLNGESYRKSRLEKNA